MLIPWRDLMRGLTRRFAEWALLLSCLAGVALVLCNAAPGAIAAPGSMRAPQPPPILFIESNVPDHQQLAAGTAPDLEVVVLDARRDGLRQMADALAGRRDVPAVHVISHGASGALDLGTLQLDRAGLAERGADLARIRSALRPGADLLLYGCEVAQGAAGQEFMAQLASTLGANVAASSNATGNAVQGGDWTLERETGPVRSAALAFPAYGHLLPSVAGTLSVPFNQPDVSFSTPKMTDGQSGTGTVDIPGIVYEVYFANTGNTQTGRITNVELLDGTGSMLIYFDDVNMQFGPVKSLIIRSQGNRLFGLASFLIQDPSEWEATYTATAYHNNAQVGTPATFTTGNSTNPVTITLGTQFQNVDEVRITSDGGLSGDGANLSGEGFNTFVFANPTGNADLSGLTASAGAFNVAFAANTTSYTLSVPNATGSTTITPTVDTPGATVKVNGTAVASGTASAPIALNVGSNTITTVVTALDGVTTKTYTVTVTRAPPPLSNNANLSNLALSAGVLSPAFAPGTTSYAASVPFATASITVTPTVADATATVTVNGVATPSGGAAGPIALAVGANTITTVVTAQDGTTTKTYTTTVTRSAASGNNQLSALSLSSGALAPAFAPGTTSYTASVGHATTSLTVTPTVADATATVTVNGVATASGSASAGIPLAVGGNTITVTVTAQNGSSLSYSVLVTRAASANADLAALALSSGTLTPAFAAGTTGYTASVGNATASVTLTPTVADATASVAVNGVATPSGTASAPIALAVGSNTVTTVVTARDGITTKTYTVTVTRAAPPLSSNADLGNLVLSAGVLSPAFASGTTSYTASVPFTTASITLTPTVADATASVAVNGVATPSGTASAPIALAVGSNTITTVAMAQDGITTKTYTVTVTRAAPPLSSNADLSDLVLSAGVLSPAFASGTTSYTASVPFAAASITLTPTLADATASVTVNGVATPSGTASAPIALAVGSNAITTVVTAQDGTTTKIYTVTVTRAASSNNNLSALSLSSGTLSPAFAAGTTSYTASIATGAGSITVTPTAADATASITVNGAAVASGAASGALAMSPGSNTVTVVVTAQDGTAKSYVVNVTRALASSNADLSALSLSSGTLQPVFSPGVTSYTADVAFGTTSLTVTPTVSDALATVAVNGTPMASGSASGAIGLVVGSNTITTTVTAQDGTTTKTYTVMVTRSRPTAVTGSSPSGGGAVSASLSGPAGCGFDRADFILLTAGGGPLPSSGPGGYVFPQGLFDVAIGGCPSGSAVTITLIYPQPFPEGTVYMKYGPTPDQNAFHWYPFGGAAVSGNTVTLLLTDGGLGDSDLAVNGAITDPGGAAVPVGGAAGIPTLGQGAAALLSLLLAAVGFRAGRTAGAGRRPAS